MMGLKKIEKFTIITIRSDRNYEWGNKTAA
jgi:hypothetical protein